MMSENNFIEINGIKISTNEIVLNNQQEQAMIDLANFYKNKNMHSYSLLGYAGSGKTTSLRYFIRYLEKIDPLISIKFAAPTHRACFVLKSSVRRDVNTLHAVLGLQPNMRLEYFDADNIKFEKNSKTKINKEDDLLIIDEASMINDELHDYIMNITKACGVKVITLGDPAQLKPVAQVSLSKSLYGTDGFSELTIVERTGSELLLKETTHVRLSTDSKCFTFNTQFKDKTGVIFDDDASKFKDKLLRMFSSKQFDDNKLYGKVLTATNKSVSEYNQLIRESVYDNYEEYHIGEVLMGYNTFGSGFIGPKILNSADYVITTKSKLLSKCINGIDTIGYNLNVRDLYTGIPSNDLYILSRDNQQQVFDDLGIVFEELRIEAINNSKGNTGLKSKNSWSEFFKFTESFMTPKSIINGGLIKIPKTIDYGYAISIHRSQGGQFNTVFIDNKNIDKAFASDQECVRQLKYVGISRAKELAIVYH